MTGSTAEQGFVPGNGEPDITIRESRVYRGPNFWSYEQSVHLVVDIGRLEQRPTDTLPGFTETLVDLLPGLKDHQCSRGRDGGFVERLVEGTWAGHVVEHVALELQRTAGHEITRGKTRSTGEDGVYNVIYGYLDDTVGTLAGRLAVRLINHLIPDNDLAAPDGQTAFDFSAEHAVSPTQVLRPRSYSALGYPQRQGVAASGRGTRRRTPLCPTTHAAVPDYPPGVARRCARLPDQGCSIRLRMRRTSQQCQVRSAANRVVGVDLRSGR